MKIELLSYEDLSEEDKHNVFNVYANYLKITHDGEVIVFRSDGIEPEDVSFTRDLSWIPDAVKKAYVLGYKDGSVDR